MIHNIRSRFAAVDSDEFGTETIEVVLLTVFFVLVIGGVALLFKSKISASVKNLSDNFDAINDTSGSSYGFGD